MKEQRAYIPERVKYQFDSFHKLYDFVSKKSLADVFSRSRTNKKATDQEFSLGCYIESLHPYLRSAILLIHAKGYGLTSWGTDIYDVDKQYLLGDFRLDAVTKDRLREKNVVWDEYLALQQIEATHLSFEPGNPNLIVYRESWDNLAAILPDTENGLMEVWRPASADFRVGQQSLKLSNPELFNQTENPAA